MGANWRSVIPALAKAVLMHREGPRATKVCTPCMPCDGVRQLVLQCYCSPSVPSLCCGCWRHGAREQGARNRPGWHWGGVRTETVHPLLTCNHHTHLEVLAAAAHWASCVLRPINP